MAYFCQVNNRDPVYQALSRFMWDWAFKTPASPDFLV
jgi:hypothetical protein